MTLQDLFCYHLFMLRTLYIFGAIVFFLSIFPSNTHASVLPRFKKTAAPVTKVRSGSGGAIVSARLRADRQALNVSFRNLQNVSSIFYTLTYKTNGKDEGAGGTIEPAGQTNIDRVILFGTCSSGVCRYHSSITNAKLEATITYTSGKKVLKRFRIKV